MCLTTRTPATSSTTAKSKTLSRVWSDAKIDVIGFDACLMAMLETAYALRDSGSVMVASEELEPGDGWSYDNFLRRLSPTPPAPTPPGWGR